VYYTVYLVTNRINGKCYVGKHQTLDLNDDYMGSGKLLKRAQEKYGIENFEKQILYVFKTEQEMNAKEAELVTEEFCLREDTYNICAGGNGGFSYINREGKNLYGKNGQHGYGKENLISGGDLKERLIVEGRFDDWRENISNSLRIRYDNLGHHWTGMKHKEESKKKIGEKNSISQLGSRNSQYGSFWITNGYENKKIKSIDLIPEKWYRGRVITKSI
jgi:hypothetical protein